MKPIHHVLYNVSETLANKLFKLGKYLSYRKDYEMNIFKTSAILLGVTALISGAYIVKQGDTLWDLSGEYFQDPFAWPDLWEKNRHIQDPHWIYPGDSLYMGEPQDSTTPTEEKVAVVVKKNNCETTPDTVALPQGVQSAGCDNDDRDDNFEDMLGDLRSRAKSEDQRLKKNEEIVYYYKQRPQPKIFNAYYQIHSPESHSIEDMHKDSSWIEVESDEKNTPILHIQESEIVVNVGKKTHLKVKKGDIIELWDAKKILVSNRNENAMEERALTQLTGYAQITAVGDKMSRAVIVKAFREIYMSQTKARLKKKLEPINVTGYENKKEASFDNMAVITYAHDPSLLIGAYSYVFIDYGTDNGYNAGDAVAIWEKDKRDESIPPRLLGRGVITHADSDNAIVLVRELYSNSRRVEIGHYVSLTHQAKIKK